MILTIDELLEKIEDSGEVEIQIRENHKVRRGPVDSIELPEGQIVFIFLWVAALDENQNEWTFIPRDENLYRVAFDLEIVKISEFQDGRIGLVQAADDLIGEMFLGGYKRLDPGDILNFDFTE
jgi:hypothetical protein